MEDFLQVCNGYSVCNKVLLMMFLTEIQIEGAKIQYLFLSFEFEWHSLSDFATWLGLGFLEYHGNIYNIATINKSAKVKNQIIWSIL